MTPAVTLIACEGRHDMALLLGCMQALGWNKRGPIRALPDALRGLVPQKPTPREGRLDFWFPPLPEFLESNGEWAVIRYFEGERVLTNDVVLLAEQLGAVLTTLVIVVDADDKGVEARERSLQKLLGAWTAEAVRAGAVVPGAAGRPRVGLWVSPDNAALGSLDDLLLACVAATRAEVATAARTIVVAPHFNLSDSDVKKAILGVLGQADAPAAALANAIRSSTDRLAGAPTTGPLMGLCAFLLAATDARP